MNTKTKKKIYEAVRKVCNIAVWGFDAELVEDHFEEIVDEELIAVIDKMFQPVSTPDTLHKNVHCVVQIPDDEVDGITSMEEYVRECFQKHPERIRYEKN